MPIITTTLLLRVQLDQCVDTHDGDASFDGRLELLDLAHARLKHTSLQAVVYLAICEVETVVLVVLRLGQLFRILRGRICWVDGSLREGVSRSQVGHKLGSILCGVDGEGLRDGEEGLGESCNSELLTRALCIWSVLSSHWRRVGTYD